MTPSHTQERLMILANQLLDSTQRGHTKWNVADDTNTSFQAKRRSGSVTIASDDEDGAFPYSLTLFDTDGRKVETLTTGGTPDEGLLGISEPFEWNELLHKLYDVARGR